MNSYAKELYTRYGRSCFIICECKNNNNYTRVGSSYHTHSCNLHDLSGYVVNRITYIYLYTYVSKAAV